MPTENRSKRTLERDLADRVRSIEKIVGLLDEEPMANAKQGDRDKCYKVGCKGTMTYHQKLNIDLGTGKVIPSGSVGARPDPNFSGWLCDTCNEAFWDKP
jgi:hypothetical protein